MGIKHYAKEWLDAVKGALANDNYRYYAAGNVLSHFGTWIQRVGMGARLGAYPITILAGAIGFADMVPAMILAPLRGLLQIESIV